MQILVNNARMILRKNKRVVCTEEMDRYMLGNSECISDVWETVLALEDELRTIVVLYYYQGFKISEIAMYWIYQREQLSLGFPEQEKI